MNKVAAPLAPGETGPAVANLQDALLLLVERDRLIIADDQAKATLLRSLARERRRAIFGDDGTLSLVRMLQSQHGLGQGSEVDRATAQLLNRLMAELGALDAELPAPEAPAPLVVRGQITWQDGSPATGVTVTAFDCRTNSEPELGAATTDDSGQYTLPYRIEQSRRAQRRGIHLRIAVLFDAQSGPLSSEIHYNVAADQTIELRLAALPPNLPSELELLLSALDPLLDGVLIAELSPRSIDLLAGETGIERRRIELLALAARYAAELAAEEEPPTRRQRAARATIPTAAFYAWFRLDLPAELEALFALPIDTHSSTLKTALERRIVPADLAAALDGIGARIEQIKLGRILAAPALGTTTTLSDMLATLPAQLDRAQQLVIAAAIADLRPDHPELNKQIAAIPGFDGDAAGVARTLRLGALTGGHAPLAQALQLWPQFAEAPAGTLRPLAALRPEGWLDLAYTHGVPSELEMTPVAYANALAARVEQQFPTATLAAHVAEGRRLAQQPMLTGVSEFLRRNAEFDIVTANLNVLPAQLEAGNGEEREQLVGGLRALQHMQALNASWDETATLLENELYSPHQLLAAGPGQLTAMLDGQLAPERVVALYREAEALHSVTFAAITSALSGLSGPPIMPEQFDTAGRELNPDDLSGVGLPPIPPKPFPNDGGTGGSVGLATLEQVLASRGSGFDPKKALILREPPLKKVLPPTGLTLNLGGVIDHQPSLRALFGEQDACGCGHCNSVLSPAAYFVDVLQFIKDARLDTLLLERRPDLQDVELSCNNTNTVVPAIDLALETLENAVVFASPLVVSLPPGTNAEAQLRGAIVGAGVRAALKKTVRNLPDNVQATRDTPQGNVWTVVDGHRRWKLTTQNSEQLQAELATGQKQNLDLAGLDLPALLAALDQGAVASGAEAAFARLFAGNQLQAPDLTNYAVTITPLPGGMAWRVAYQFVGRLLIAFDADAPISDQRLVVLQTPLGAAWWGEQQLYSPATITAVRAELASSIAPELVQAPLAAHFYKALPLTVAAAGTDVWTVTSARRELTLRFAPAQLTITALTYQSGDPDADALAWPENHNPEAYVQLNKPSFPWSLPLDLPLEEVRLFLARSRCSRLLLIELMLPIDQPLRDDARFARELLALNKVEATLISAAETAPAVYDCWGVAAHRPLAVRDATAKFGYALASIAPLEQLKNVSILLQQSRLGFEELQALLATRFVSGGAAALSIEPTTTCTPSEMRLPALTPAHLDRMHRFVRLQRRLGWTTRELDSAIDITTGARLDGETLLKLADVVQLRDLLQLPVSAILAWWSEPGAATSRMSELAQALSLSSSELAHALALLDTVDSFTSPGATLDFCAQVAAMQRSGMTFETLRYLLQHHQTPGSNTSLDEKQLMQLAVAARNAVRALPDSAENTLPLTPADAENGARVLRLAREDAAIMALATTLGAERELVDELLRTRLQHPVNSGEAAIAALLDAAFVSSAVAHAPTAALPPATALDPAVKAAVDAADKAVDQLLVRLHKALLICAVLKLSRADLRLLQTPAAGLRGFVALDFNTLPVALDTAPASVSAPARLAAFMQLLKLAQLRAIAPGASDLLSQYAAIDFDAVGSISAAQTLLATGLGLEASEIGAAAAQLHVNSVEQYRDPITLTRLVELLLALKQLGAPVAQAIALTAAAPDDAAAIGARELLRSKYGAAQWHNLIKPIADILRERQRNALVDYLIDRDQRRAATIIRTQLSGADPQRGADDLYERYLIDVQTGSCLKTTRLLQATAAAQLFVQRVILNLEKGWSLTPDKRERWEWMRSYRVWEANRKVFLFPENWLLPELRDDKTAIFRQMESILTEQEPSPALARSALLSYLEELGELAQISVIAMYEDQRRVDQTTVDANGAAKVIAGVERTLYVVGRTPNEPYRYFWRSCVEFGNAEKMVWSGWEALEIDNANDFIMPFVFEGDLHVAWPIFRKTTDERDATQLRWEVKIAWQRRTSQGWVKRKMSPHTLSPIPRLIGITELRSFVFRVRKDEPLIPMASNLRQERIMIDCYPAKDTAAAPDLGEKVEHIPDPESDTVVLLNQKNVSLTVEATVFEKYHPPEDAKVYVYRRANNATLRLKYLRAHNDFHNTTTYPMDLQSTSVDGVVTFPNLAVQTHGELALTVKHPELAVKKVRSVALLNNSTAVDGTSWTWKPTFVLEIKTPLDTPYYPSRAVFFDEVFESFRLTSSSDMEIFKPDPLEAPKLSVTKGMSRLGSQLIWTGGGSTVKLGGDGDLAVTTEFGPRVQLTPATVATLPATTTPEIWYLQDATTRCYLRLAMHGWNVYPDGQDFVGWYRTVAAASAFALFDPRMQGRQRDGQQPIVPAPQASTRRSTTAPAISFTPTSPYANYNWELFLHAPLAIADNLASQQRFEDARRWLHAVFDPTTETKDASNRRGQFWRFLPFNNAAQPKAIAKLLTWLADPGKVDPNDAEEFKSLTTQIAAWQKNPFMPHVVARLRPSAYQWHAFFAYLELLIGWGDQLFRRDTRESVNDATLLYVLAAKLLGPRPRVIPAATPPHALTYRLLQANPNKLDGTSNAWVSYAELPGVKQLSRQASQAKASAQASQLGAPTLPGRGEGMPLELEPWAGKSAAHLLTSLSALAFCIPQNEKVSEFYDRVEDRLFNLRNCRNIDGLFRDLPLYEPPIDPLLLIRARAAGVSTTDAITGLYAPLPNYRFSFTLQKALELCAELKSLGGALLSALEKQDAEALTRLRSGHEIALLELVRETRTQQIAEAEANITALQQSEKTILERLGQYQKLLGKTTITKDQAGQPVVEQSSALTVATDAVGESSELGLILMEVAQLNWTQKGNRHTQSANTAHVIAGVLSMLPNISIGGATVSVSFGGSNLASAASAVAKSIESTAIGANYFATQANTFAGYERRQDEWVYQSKLAVAELKQLGEQILAAQIRKEIARRELSNHKTQIENAQSVDAFMREKFTSKELYRWMSSQLAQVYSSTYQLALDQARRAERAFQHELGLESQSKPFVRHGQWDTLKSGLLAGEQLHYDLKRLEAAYYEQNRREYELTKQISLAQLSPLELMNLKSTGRCQIVLPEWIFDLDFPGHYFRRVKSVSLTIPCVVGPYASVNATLTLGPNKVRTKPSLAGTQAYSDPSGHNYQTTFRSNQQIATSNAQQDSGLFELNFRDERYMPFEHAGVISTWTLELSGRWLDTKQDLIDLSQFDFETISDVVLHLRYTARQGSEELKQQALAALKTMLADIAKTPQHRLFSLRHEFPTEWHQLRTASDHSAGFGLHQGRFPLLAQRGAPRITSMDYVIILKQARPALQIALAVTKPGATTPLPALTKAATPLPALTKAARYWVQTQEKLATDVSARPEAASWQLTFVPPATDSEIANIEDIVLLVHYTQ